MNSNPAPEKPTRNVGLGWVGLDQFYQSDGLEACSSDTLLLLFTNM